MFGAEVPPLNSTRGLSGHAMGAAGALEAVYTLLMMRQGFIAPTANLDDVDPACDGVPHVRSLRETELQTTMTVNAGLGGTNACLIFRKV